MEEKEKTAYNEAGHCYRAFTASPMAFRSVCIYEENDQCWGDTRFRRSWVKEQNRAEVAVAGFLAEAKAVASEDGPRDVAWNNAVRDRILELLEEEIPKPEAEQEDHVWPLQVTFDWRRGSGCEHHPTRSGRNPTGASQRCRD